MTFEDLDPHGEEFFAQYSEAIQWMEPELAISMQPQTLLAVISHLQLSLRHPDMDHYSASASVVRGFVEQTKTLFPPIVQRVIDMGADPRWDFRFRTVDGVGGD